MAKNLTPRQRRILMMRLADQSTSEIAERLGVTVSTVRNTLSQSYAKLGVTGLHGAALWAVSVGLVEMPEIGG